MKCGERRNDVHLHRALLKNCHFRTFHPAAWPSSTLADHAIMCHVLVSLQRPPHHPSLEGKLYEPYMSPIWQMQALMLVSRYNLMCIER